MPPMSMDQVMFAASGTASASGLSRFSRFLCLGMQKLPRKQGYRRPILTPLMFCQAVRCEAADGVGDEAGGYDCAGPTGLLCAALVGNVDFHPELSRLGA